MCQLHLLLVLKPAIVKGSQSYHLSSHTISLPTCPSVNSFPLELPKGSPSRGGDVAVYVVDINQPSLRTPFLFCSCVYFCLVYGPFDCISFHKFSQQLSTFSLCSCLSYFCLIGPFNYISVCESLLQL